MTIYICLKKKYIRSEFNSSVINILSHLPKKVERTIEAALLVGKLEIF